MCLCPNLTSVFLIHIKTNPNSTNKNFYTEEEVKCLSDAVTTDKDKMVEACDRSPDQRLSASYVNYYLANDAVILPQFGDTVYDAEAMATLKGIFPDRKVIGVYSREILLGGGNIHCITQQVPISFCPE